MAARQSAPGLGALCASTNHGEKLETSLRPRHWEVSLGYRWQNSFRHFIGTDEQKIRETQRTQVVNNIHLFDVAVAYQVTPRWSLSLSAPFLVATRTIPGEIFRRRGFPNAQDQVFQSAGIGDMSVSARMWIWRPPTESRANISVGIGLKMPTGNPGVVNTIVGPDGKPIRATADQSIQPGDGGWGFTLGLQAYKSIRKTTLFFTGTYLFNPEDTNGVRTGRSRPSEAIMSVPDQYLYRGGVAYPFPKVRGMGVSIAGRIEGVPVRDAFGKATAFAGPAMPSRSSPD